MAVDAPGQAGHPESTLRWPVLAAALRRERRGLVVWGLALGGVAGLYAGLYPQIRDQPQMAQLAQGKVAVLGSAGQALGLSDVLTPAGYLDASVFGLLGPMLLIIFAVINGSRAVAGDDEQGVLDLYLAQPVSRSRYLAERMAALALQIAALAGLAGLVVIAANQVQHDGVPVGNLVGATAGLGLLALAFGLLAVLVGAAVGHRGAAVGVTAGAAVVSYLLFGFSSQVPWLAGTHYLSPFWWDVGHKPAGGGLTAVAFAVLAGVPLLLALAAVPLFERRDLGG